MAERLQDLARRIPPGGGSSGRGGSWLVVVAIGIGTAIAIARCAAAGSDEHPPAGAPMAVAAPEPALDAPPVIDAAPSVDAAPVTTVELPPEPPVPQAEQTLIAIELAVGAIDPTVHAIRIALAKRRRRAWPSWVTRDQLAERLVKLIELAEAQPARSIEDAVRAYTAAIARELPALHAMTEQLDVVEAGSATLDAEQLAAVSERLGAASQLLYRALRAARPLGRAPAGTRRRVHDTCLATCEILSRMPGRGPVEATRTVFTAAAPADELRRYARACLRAAVDYADAIPTDHRGVDIALSLGRVLLHESEPRPDHWSSSWTGNIAQNTYYLAQHWAR